jgi:hypothetical protein
MPTEEKQSEQMVPPRTDQEARFLLGSGLMAAILCASCLLGFDSILRSQPGIRFSMALLYLAGWWLVFGLTSALVVVLPGCAAGKLMGSAMIRSWFLTQLLIPLGLTLVLVLPVYSWLIAALWSIAALAMTWILREL